MPEVYTAHFGLKELPFVITPDPRYLFMSERHREALAHLLYGACEGGGFVQLTGEVGTGKTTLCRCLLEQLPPHVDVALILNPKLTSVELLGAVCDELRIAYPEGTTSPKTLVDRLYAYLLEAHAKGRRTVLIIDEAQDLSADVLEQIRLLTNLETTREKLLQIILIGQPELVEILAREDLRQLAQRITARYHLEPFSEEETRTYIRHRLQIAGRTRGIFTDGAIRRVHRHAGGIPRLVNVICDRALLGAFAQERTHVDARMIARAANEVRGPRANRWALAHWPRAAAAAIGALLALAGVVLAAKPFSPRAVTTHAGPAAPNGPAAREAAVVAAPAVAGAAPAGSATSPGSVPPAVSLATLLADTTVASDEASAFTTLYARRGNDDPRARGQRGCESASAAGLRCLLRTGSWTRLRRYNLPAILELTAPTGTRHFVAAIGLEDRAVTLELGGRRVTVPLAEVEPLWEGDFMLLWKNPPITTVPLVPGTRARDVEWLRRQLAVVDGVPAAAGTREVYDPGLRERVVKFQRSHAIEPDGVVGEETLVHLMLATRDRGVPQLAAMER